MTQYLVRFSSFAIRDLGDSFEWGVENWGETAALRWLDEFERHIERRLSDMPTANAVAPETVEFDTEVRQLIYHRYRVLFTIKGTEVLVLRIRGPFTERK